MSAPDERRGTAPGGGRFRVWEKGSGPRVGYFAGLLGLPRWLPFLDALARTRRVVAPSLPGTPGGADWEDLDSHLDWALASGDAWFGAGLDGADLIGASAGGALAAEVAALWPRSVRRLVLIGPLGLFEPSDPISDVFAQRPGAYAPLVSNRPAEVEAYVRADSNDANEVVEWDIAQQRTRNAAARYLWPLGDTRVRRRLPRITCPTLIIWGDDDRVMSRAYATRFAEAIAGEVKITLIAGAGHMADFDQPQAVAEAVEAFLAR
ncbi:MAG: alpha/beta fold hydrolase [Alphaproteobacteria bacterium]|nr:alpha/beta fold hydrolase [Alphaproteobacteria bacterium]